MDQKELIGRRIKSLRRMRGYSQEKLAEIMGVSSKYLSSIERGEENPTLDLFLKLSQGLDVRIHEIFKSDPEENEPRILRKRLKALVGEVKDENLIRIMQILEALLH